MDERKSILNTCVSILSRIILVFFALLVRRLVIRHLGNEVNGLDNLYTNIIGFLSVAELGIGRAIVFSMYKPFINGERKRIAALYCYYRNCYCLIGAVIFGIGMIIMIFLPKLINGYDSLGENVYLTFFLMLISVVLSYVYSAKTALIEANKDHYIVTSILTISRLIRYVLQIITILLCKSFIIFLVCLIVETIVIWILTDLVVNRKYADILIINEKLDSGIKAEISRNIKAMFMHRIGNVLVNTIDSMIISGFIGVVVLGKYSNYTYIASIITGTIVLFFSSQTSVIGHLCAYGDENEINKVFSFFYSLNYILGVVFFLGYYAVIDNVIAVFLGNGLIETRAIAFIISLNQFIAYMRQAQLLFRNASGTFYYDRWKPIAEGLLNLFLSLLFVIIFPTQYKVVGVIVATIATNLLVCDTVEPFVVFKYIFKRSPKNFYIRNYSYIGLFITALIIMTFLIQETQGPILGIIINGLLSIVISFVLLVFLAVVDKTFRTDICTMAKKTQSIVRNVNRLIT